MDGGRRENRGRRGNRKVRRTYRYDALKAAIQLVDVLKNVFHALQDVCQSSSAQPYNAHDSRLTVSTSSRPSLFPCPTTFRSLKCSMKRGRILAPAMPAQPTSRQLYRHEHNAASPKQPQSADHHHPGPLLHHPPNAPSSLTLQHSTRYQDRKAQSTYHTNIPHKPLPLHLKVRLLARHRVLCMGAAAAAAGIG